MGHIYNHQRDSKTLARTKVEVPRGFHTEAMPPIDLRAGFPVAPDQGPLGACGPNSWCWAMGYDQKAQGLLVRQPSRLFLYYNTRVLMGDTADDTGVANEDLAQAAQQGVCDETLWPYDVSQFAVKPPQAAYDQAPQDATLLSTPIAQDLNTLYSFLAAGLPCVTDLMVYPSYESVTAANPVVPVPSAAELAAGSLGGHDNIIGGINVQQDYIWIGNVWSPSWGLNGWAQFPLSKYLLVPALAGTSMWAVKKVGPIVTP